MSITVRLWSKSELERIKSDKWLATVFMNGKTFSEEEIVYYPYEQRRTYLCAWGIDEVKIYATDVRQLKRFLEVEYTRLPDSIEQLITQYRPVILE